jgi:hypothetical protein
MTAKRIQSFVAFSPPAFPSSTVFSAFSAALTLHANSFSMILSKKIVLMKDGRAVLVFLREMLMTNAEMINDAARR